MVFKDSYMETSWSWSEAVPSQPPEAQIPSLWGCAGRRSASRFGGGTVPQQQCRQHPHHLGLAPHGDPLWVEPTRVHPDHAVC